MQFSKNRMQPGVIVDIKDIDLDNAYKNPISFQNSTIEYIDKEQSPIKQLICIQAKINRIVLFNSALEYVYKIHDKKDLSELKKVRASLFANNKYDISNFKVNNNIVLNNAKKIKQKLTGYTTYGDFEDFFATILAPIIDINQFMSLVITIKQEIENIPERIGLVAVWIKKMQIECNELYKLGVST